VAYGRIYFAAETGLYCLGDRSRPLRQEPAERPERVAAAAPAAPADAKAAAAAAPASGAGAVHLLQVVPAEVLIRPGEPARFRAVAADDAGLPVAVPGGPAAVQWSLSGVAGSLDAGATFVPDPGKGFQTGEIVARLGDLTAKARVRVVPPLPWTMDFKALAPGSSPPGWIGGGRFAVKETRWGKVLAKSPVRVGLQRSNAYVGPAAQHGYTVQADLLGTQSGFVRPDMGLIASGYVLDLMGANQRLQLRAWDTELRLMQEVEFKWDPDTWYTMKLRADTQGAEGLIRGKVWRRGEPEPAAWTVTAHDPRPVRSGSPGLYGYSAVEILFDNLSVAPNR